MAARGRISWCRRNRSYHFHRVQSAAHRIPDEKAVQRSVQPIGYVAEFPRIEPEGSERRRIQWTHTERCFCRNRTRLKPPIWV